MNFEEFQKKNNTEIRNNSELVLGSGEYQMEY
jgi:hypothetical protein